MAAYHKRNARKLGCTQCVKLLLSLAIKTFTGGVCPGYVLVRLNLLSRNRDSDSLSLSNLSLEVSVLVAEPGLACSGKIKSVLQE